MEARSADAIPADDGLWQFEPKWDGFRCLAYKQDGVIDIRGKSGKPLGRFFPEIAVLLRDLTPDRFVLDGELVIQQGDHLSFDALQMRLHPAESRIRKLAAETPAKLIVFDMLLSPEGENLMDQPLTRRRQRLERFAHEVAIPDKLMLSPSTHDRELAKHWLDQAGDGTTDGIVAKRLDLGYEPGQRTMVKVKRLRTADCVVGGFRYETNSRQVGSLLLGLYDKSGKLNHVGFTSTISRLERPALTRRLEAIREPPGFTGRAPGGPSRWSTERSGAWEPIRPEMIVEVRYDHITDGRFRHGTKLMRWRPDKSPDQCTFEQVERSGSDDR